PPRNKACFLYARSRCPHRSFTVGGRIDDFNGRIKQNNDKQGKPRPPKHEKEVGMAIQPLSQPIIQPIDHEYSLPPFITYHPPEKERSFPVPSLSSPRALFQQKNRVAWEAKSPTRLVRTTGRKRFRPATPISAQPQTPPAGSSAGWTPCRWEPEAPFPRSPSPSASTDRKSVV